MKSKRIVLFVIAICTLTTTLNAETRKEFIRKYKHIAVKEMERTGIPASIKLAQGILESGCGASPLSTEANNHFGIKCHDWTGDTFHMDDDMDNECFRKYTNPEQSWIDHSEFLMSRPRYASLFKLESTDYKGWARGLKAAGYATNPQYADKLIKIIEEEELYHYDHLVKHPSAVAQVPNSEAKNAAPGSATVTTTVSYRKREEMRNGLTCIETKEGDSLEAIATYYGIKPKKLLAYNDMQSPALQPGQYVYLRRKKARAAKGYEFHRVKAGDTLFSISQQYGVRLKSLVNFNYTDINTSLVEGEKIFLRSKASL